jgi:hypothetical protein
MTKDLRQAYVAIFLSSTSMFRATQNSDGRASAFHASWAATGPEMRRKPPF